MKISKVTNQGQLLIIKRLQITKYHSIIQQYFNRRFDTNVTHQKIIIKLLYLTIMKKWEFNNQKFYLESFFILINLEIVN